MSNKICLLVHTGDQSRYMWPMWHRYWKQNFQPYAPEGLDTVFLSETHADVRLDGVQREYTGPGKPWAQGLKEYLQRSEYSYVIYHHEDYLPVEQIDVETIRDLYQTMISARLDLIKCCGWWGGFIDEHAPYSETDSITSLGGKKLWRYNNSSQYLISHQSSIWNADFLASTLTDNNMSPWGHELLGTELLRRRQVPLYAYREKSPIEYAEVLNHKKLRPGCEKWFTPEELNILKNNNCI